MSLKPEFLYTIHKEESLKVSSSTISIKVNTITGKDGEQWVCVSPSLEVSGYGSTELEARESFTHNMEVFCEDIQALKSNEKFEVLTSLGWEQKKFAKKQFSKAFIDKDGILQNLENPKVALETVA